MVVADEELRARVDAFVASVDDVLIDVDDPIDRARRYRRALADAGLAGLSYPQAYGGHGLDDGAEHTVAAALAERVPRHDSVFGIGIGMALPTIRDHGSDELCRELIPAGLRGDHLWCQLYSEPGAGSDLASLTTRAVLDGDEWVVTGQKVWSSNAQHADLGVLLARTDPDVPKHRGITMLVLPMHQAGVEVRPLRQMTDVSEFSEVFMDGARIPRHWVIGDVGDGWRMATALLAHERTSLGSGGGRQPAPTDLVVTAARRFGRLDDPRVRQRLAELHTGERIVSWLRHRRAHPSVGKLWRTRQGRRAAALLAELAGPVTTAWDTDDPAAVDAVYRILDSPALSIGGGTDEVQRTTLGDRVLGLPREPSVDRHIPFRQTTTGGHR